MYMRVCFVFICSFAMRLHKLGVVGRRELDANALEHVERQAREKRDRGHLPQELDGPDELRVEVLAEYDQAEYVADEREQHGDDHHVVPRADGQADHQVLGEDERRERDGHYVTQVLVEQLQAAVHDHRALIDADQHPQQERLVGQRATL